MNMVNTNNLFQLTFPDDWRETTTYTFEGPFDSGVQHNLVLVIDPSVDKEMQVSDYAKQQLGTSKEALPGFELINEKEILMPSGLPAYEIVYRYSPSDDQTFFQKQMYLVIEGKGYVFSSTFSKKTLQTIGPYVDQIVASFRPLNVENPQ
jgi:hypothetical protein